ncbi:MAG: zinc-ribbon domain-containing protein [Oscillospiraceae bacterium]|nr:zinc-ribbon domain-containing protein [Oscillospiraceae bacterium]
MVLSETHINLMEEWDFEKNEKIGIHPNEITAGSNKKVWWKCNKGHEWEAQIAKRAIGRGCPVCSNKKVLKGVNDIETTHPSLLLEWNYQRNNKLGIFPTEVTSGSSKKVWWKCNKGHEWEAQIKNKNIGRGCPVCSGRIPEPSVSDLFTINPKLVNEEWDYEKNDENGIKPTEISCGSGKKVYWKCSKGHEWLASICKRIGGQGCPICSNHKVLKGYNDLATVYPQLLTEWNYVNNEKIGIRPTEVTAGSEKIVWWNCPKGHTWKSMIANRVKGHGCTICAGKTIVKGINDLATTNTELLKEWNYEKNDILEIYPTNVSSGSNKKVWWKCSEGHVWQNLISHRVRGRGCPICSNKQVVEGVNDLASTNPELLKEWDYIKNGNAGIRPTDITFGSGKKVWWLCPECSHSWRAYIYSRTSGTDCPRCKKEFQTSFLEQAVFYYIKKIYPDSINGDRDVLAPLELDIYIPSISTAIEYDGQLFHTNNKKDSLKNELCNKNGIRLIRIREENCPQLGYDERIKVYTYNHKNLKKLSEIIADIILNVLGKECDFVIDVEKDKELIINQYIRIKKENSISNKFPHLLKEWNYEKNGVLNPELISCGSTIKVWWTCKLGHEWKAIIYSRAREKNSTGCPYCSNQKILVGFNDLATTFPKLLKEWCYEKNNDLGLQPTNVTSGSGKKVWWTCEFGHNWIAQICARTSGTGCPVCNNKQVLFGVNDLTTTNPELMLEWDFIKNEVLGLRPTEIYAGSKKKAWWKCSQGHEWKAEIASRVRGSKCLVCSGNLVVAGINDVATTYPNLMKEWLYEKNDKLGVKPNEVSAGCHKKVWWKCSKCGHQWQAVIGNRARAKFSSGCPSCACKKKK